MAVSLTNIVIHNNPSRFLDPFQFEITFECNMELQDDIDFSIVYVGSAQTEQCDQILEDISVGPVPIGVNKFMLEAPPPDPSKIPPADLLGVTVVLLKVSYMSKEFVRVGYYVNIEYTEEELRENPPTQPIYEKLSRNILAEKPRVTRFPFKWFVNRAFL
ncbi:histone chaperone ASF1A-like protein [Paraphysoderma sedebokerense]|nr:histone chaperone ASF1A-like protein [Paraphysoderma sedebokerense]